MSNYQPPPPFIEPAQGHHAFTHHYKIFENQDPILLEVAINDWLNSHIVLPDAIATILHTDHQSAMLANNVISYSVGIHYTIATVI
jgi:hypothetical protein